MTTGGPVWLWLETALRHCGHRLNLNRCPITTRPVTAHRECGGVRPAGLEWTWLETAYSRRGQLVALSLNSQPMGFAASNGPYYHWLRATAVRSVALWSNGREALEWLGRQMVAPLSFVDHIGKKR